MFEKFARKFKQGAVEDFKRTFKEEIAQFADDILPQLVGIASIGILILSNIPSSKPAMQQMIINNYFF